MGGNREQGSHSLSSQSTPKAGLWVSTEIGTLPSRDPSQRAMRWGVSGPAPKRTQECGYLTEPGGFGAWFSGWGAVAQRDSALRLRPGLLGVALGKTPTA